MKYVGYANCWAKPIEKCGRGVGLIIRALTVKFGQVWSRFGVVRLRRKGVC